VAAVSVVLVAGHNLLDPVIFSLDAVFYVPWAVLHARSWIDAEEYLRGSGHPIRFCRGSGLWPSDIFPGCFFHPALPRQKGRCCFWAAASVPLALFFILRLINGYGEKPWHAGETLSRTLMSFFNVTKYPPSLILFFSPLVVELLVLAFFERHNHSRPVYWLSVFGSVPMFFYILL